MIQVKVKKNKKGARLEVRNANGNIFNHDYNRGSSAWKAWRSFVKQIKVGKVKISYDTGKKGLGG